MFKVIPFFGQCKWMLFFGLIFFSAKNGFSQKKYTVTYHYVDKDSSYKNDTSFLKTQFINQEEAKTYTTTIKKTLTQRGYPVASVDSSFYDSSHAEISLYLGEKYQWDNINTDSVDRNALLNSGWNEKYFHNREINFLQLRKLQDAVVNYYENTGYPFAEVSVDEIKIENNKIEGALKVKKGPLYHIDSIRVYGKVKIKNLFLQHYLGIFDGDVYNNEKLSKVSERISNLSFLQEQSPSDVTMLGTGAILNLYLEPRRGSQVNVLIGFVPGNTVTGKTSITADVHLDLKNALGAGESILLNWQQLQPQSPRLNLAYNHPFILDSKFGVDLAFNLLKRDSAYLQLNAQLGIQYFLSSTQTFKIFYQNENSYLLGGGYDTNQIILTKRLPPYIDVKSGNVGIGYHFENTNYHFNPRHGNEIDLSATAGIKKITKNNDIINLKDPANPAFDFNSLYDSLKMKSYQAKVLFSAAHYFPVGKSTVLKTALNGALIQSPQLFQNELYRIGGYQILRGFDEESIYANQYAVFTAEYRYLVGINSFFFGFSDAGISKTKYQSYNYSNTYISAGIGLELETKFGLLNLSYAIGKRNDIKFDIRNASKIHFGYINYF